MDDSFYKAFFPPEVRVCGVKLRPFSLWHRVCLGAVDSPFLDGGREFTPADLLVALQICKTEWPNQPDLRPSLLGRWRKRRMTNSHIRFARAGRVFVRYLSDFSSRPQFWTSESDNRRILTGPPILSQVCSLVANGHSLKDAWNMSPGEADWYDCTQAERMGAEDRFLWEDDLEDDLPDLNEVDEETLMKQAILDLGPERAKQWAKARKESARTNKC